MHAALIDGQMCLAISDENEYFETWRPYIYFSVESFASENSFVSQWPTDIHSLSFSLDPSTYFAGNKFSEVKTLSFSLRCLHLCHQKVSSKGHENGQNSHFNAKRLVTKLPVQGSRGVYVLIIIPIACSILMLSEKALNIYYATTCYPMPLCPRVEHYRNYRKCLYWHN